MNLEDYEDVELADDDLDFDDDEDDLDDVLDMLEDDDDDDDVDDVDDIERRRKRGRRYFRRKWRRKMRRSRSTFRRARPKRGRWATVEQVEKGFQRSDRNDKVLGKRVTALKTSAAKFASRTARDHKKQQGEIDNIKQMTLFMSLLGGDKKLKIKEITDDRGNAVANTLNGQTIKVEDTSDALDKFLPFMMLGGMGGKGGGFGDNPMMMFLLIDALGDK